MRNSFFTIVGLTAASIAAAQEHPIEEVLVFGEQDAEAQGTDDDSAGHADRVQHERGDVGIGEDPRIRS